MKEIKIRKQMKFYETRVSDTGLDRADSWATIGSSETDEVCFLFRKYSLNKICEELETRAFVCSPYLYLLLRTRIAKTVSSSIRTWRNKISREVEVEQFLTTGKLPKLN